MEDELVTIKVANYVSELVVAKSYLEDNGILCFVKHELIGQVYPAASNGAGGIKLQVPQSEAQHAIELLIEGGFARKADYEPSKMMLKLSRVYQMFADMFKKG